MGCIPANTTSIAPYTALSALARHVLGNRRSFRGYGVALFFFALCSVSATHAAESARTDASEAFASRVLAGSEQSRIWINVGQRRFAITLANNPAAHAFASLLPLTLNMEELNGNEKKKELRETLPTNASRPGTIHTGDLLLWGPRTVVIFYQTFNSAYAYTPLGRIDDPAGLAQALGLGDVEVLFSRK